MVAGEEEPALLVVEAQVTGGVPGRPQRADASTGDVQELPVGDRRVGQHDTGGRETAGGEEFGTAVGGDGPVAGEGRGRGGSGRVAGRPRGGGGGRREKGGALALVHQDGRTGRGAEVPGGTAVVGVQVGEEDGADIGRAAADVVEGGDQEGHGIGSGRAGVDDVDVTVRVLQQVGQGVREAAAGHRHADAVHAGAEGVDDGHAFTLAAGAAGAGDVAGSRPAAGTLRRAASRAQTAVATRMRGLPGSATVRSARQPASASQSRTVASGYTTVPSML